MATVSVIVPARDAQDTIGDTLAALAAQDAGVEVEVLVVDDGSNDRTASIAAKSDAVDRVIRSTGQGAGAARNAGAAAASGALLAFTDADCRPAPGWIAAGLHAFRDAEVVQGPILPPPGAPRGPFDHVVWRERLSALYEAANLFVVRDAFTRLGGFGAGLEDRRDGRLGAPFGEDVMLGWRARRAGLRTVYEPQALVHHAVIPGTAATFIAEHSRLGKFARLGCEVPELREEFFYRRFFMSRRSAGFDLALTGVSLTLARRNPLFLAAAAPYCKLLWESRVWDPWGRVAAVHMAADAVGFASLVRGSWNARWPLL